MNIATKILYLLITLFVIVLSSFIIFEYINWSKNKQTQITLYGNVELRQVSLAFNAYERIIKLFVEEGDWVIKGQPLGKLDIRTLTHQIEKARSQITVSQVALERLKNGSRPQEIAQAQATVNAVKADVEHKRALYNRYINIVKTTNGRGVSKQNLDEARAAYNGSLAELENKQQALELAKIGPRIEDIQQAKAQLDTNLAELNILNRQLEESTLYAPVNAYVRARTLEIGDMASPQRPVYTLAITNPKWIRAYLTETDLGKVKLGMQANIAIDSFPDSLITGQVGFISSNAEFTPKYIQTEELRTSLVYEVRIYIKDPENKLKLGMPVTVYLKVTDND